MPKTHRSSRDIWHRGDDVNKEILWRLPYQNSGQVLSKLGAIPTQAAVVDLYRVSTGLMCSGLTSLVMGFEDHRKHRALTINTVDE